MWHLYKNGRNLNLFILFCHKGTVRFRQHFSKRRKEWAVGTVYCAKTFSFRRVLLENVIKRRFDSDIKFATAAFEMDQAPELPQNLGSLVCPKPSKEQAASTHTSRFCKGTETYEIYED